MKKIIWITSYPKCGNTYIRCFLSHYIFNQDSTFTFDFLGKIPKFETREVFKRVLEEKVFNNNFIYYKHFIDVQKKLIKQFGQNDLIFKTHHFFGQLNNYAFTTADTTLLFIHIIRDPREVLISYAKHNSMTIDQALEFFIKDDSIRLLKMEGIVNWALHYRSWKSFKSVPSIFIKFEELSKDPIKIFRKIVTLLSLHTKITLNETLLEKTVQYTMFDNLRRLEDKYGFKEAKEDKFFNSGKINSWKNILNSKQIKIIEKKFSKEMIELGYL